MAGAHEGLAPKVYGFLKEIAVAVWRDERNLVYFRRKFKVLSMILVVDISII